MSLALVCLTSDCLGQGTLTITFDNPPQPAGTWSAVNQYSESGMQFTAPGTMYGLVLVGSGLAGGPDDGTTHLGTLLNSTVAVNSLSGVPFSLTSFDVANDAGLLTPPTLQVLGFRQDGTTVTNNFTSVGTIFQTVHLDSGFVGLNTVHMTGGFAFDNMVVGIPEPSVDGLIVFGTLTALGWSRIRGNRLLAR